MLSGAEDLDGVPFLAAPIGPGDPAFVDRLRRIEEAVGQEATRRLRAAPGRCRSEDLESGFLELLRQPSIGRVDVDGWEPRPLQSDVGRRPFIPVGELDAGRYRALPFGEARLGLPCR